MCFLATGVGDVLDAGDELDMDAEPGMASAIGGRGSRSRSASGIGECGADLALGPLFLLTISPPPACCDKSESPVVDRLTPLIVSSQR